METHKKDAFDCEVDDDVFLEEDFNQVCYETYFGAVPKPDHIFQKAVGTLYVHVRFEKLFEFVQHEIERNFLLKVRKINEKVVKIVFLQV